MVNSTCYKKCKRCKKQFYKWQPLEFTKITASPYIKCPHCNKKYYLNLDKEDKVLNNRIGYKED